jgi:REase_DpnII-MboI
MLPEIRVALAELGIGSADEAACNAAWQRVVRFTATVDSLPEAAVMLIALEGLTQRSLPAQLGRLEPSDVVLALEGVERSLRRWPWEHAPRTPNSAVTRWNVENEYHVQDLLWAVLAPLFPDLNDEETLSPVGQKNPRTDLSIPSLRLVVEAKFMRASARFQDIIDEIASDATLYSADPRWKSLVPFVWDDSRRSEEHAKLIAGLKKLPLVVDAVVVSRPGRMTREPDAIPSGRKFGASGGRRRKLSRCSGAEIPT